MTQSNDNLELIAAHRKSIDELDEKIVNLLNERAGHSLAIRELKPGANMNHYDPVREQQIVEKLQAVSNGPMHDEDIAEIYATILKVMKAIKVD